MCFRPPRNPSNFTPEQSKLLSTLFTPNKFRDARECREIAQLLNIPEVVIMFFFNNKLLKEKLLQEESYRSTVIKRNYASLLQLLENNSASTDSQTCSTNKQQNMSNDIRCIPVTKYPDEVFQLFNFCNKNRIMLKYQIIPRHFIAISLNSDRAIEFYKQYRIYMARVKAREPSSVEVDIFSESFPAVASDEYFERLVIHMRGRNLDEVNSDLRNEIISIGLESPANTVFYEPPEQVCEHIKHYIKNIPTQQDKQECGNVTASATLRLPTNNAVDTSSAQSLTEIFAQQSNHTGRPKISQVNQVFKNETAFVATNSPVVKTEADHAFKTDPSLMDLGSSQSSSKVPNLVIQQQRAHQIGKTHQITEKGEVEPLSQFIKYCILIKTEYDQIYGNVGVSAAPPQLPMTSISTVLVPNVPRFINPSQPLIREVPIPSQSLEELRKRSAMPLHSQISLVPSGSMPLQPGRIQPLLVEPSSANQLLVIDKNRHPLITARQFPAPDRVHNLGIDNVRPSVIHQTRYTSQFFNSDPVSPFVHVPNHVQPSIPDHNNPSNSINFNHIHPNYDGSGHSRPGAIPLDKCDGGRLYVSNEADSSIPNRIKSYDSVSSNHIHLNYDGSKHSRTRASPLDKCNGARLYISEETHSSILDRINPSTSIGPNHIYPNYVGSGHSRPGAIPLDKCDGVSNEAHPSILNRINPYDSVRSNHIHLNYDGSKHSRTRATPLGKCDGGRLYVSDEAHFSIPDRINPSTSIRPNHIHPNYVGSGHSRPRATPLDKCDGGRLYVSDEAHSSIPDRTNPSTSIRPNHVHPNYVGSGHSRPRATPLDKCDGGRLYVSDEAHSSIPDRINPSTGIRPNHIYPNYVGSGHLRTGAIPLEKCDGVSNEAHTSIPNRINPNNRVRSNHIRPHYDVSKRSKPSILDRIKPNNSVRFNHIHPNCDGSGHSRPGAIPLDKYDDSRFITCDEAHPTLPNLNNPYDSIRSNHAHPSEYNDSGNSRPGAIPLDKYYGGRLIICEESHPTVLDRIKPYDNIGNQPSASEPLRPTVINADMISLNNDNNCNHINVRNLSGRLREPRSMNVPMKPLHTKIRAMPFDKVRVNNPNEECNPTQRAKTQPRALPHGRSVPKVEKQLNPQEKAPPSNN